MGTSPTMVPQCYEKSLSATPRQALRIPHFEQAAGCLNAFADHPTASGKTRYM